MASRIPPMMIHAWLRYDAIRRVLPRDCQTVLEIGAGQGSVGMLLARKFRYVGLEPDAESFAVAARRVGDVGKVVQATDESFHEEETFDVVCAFEVLEHIEDEQAALARWRRRVRPGGWLCISVPAGRERFGATDIKAGHFRRYDRADLRDVLERTGFTDVTIVSYGFPIGYALEAARNVLARRMYHPTTHEDRTAASGRWLQAPPWAAIALRIAAAPFQLLQRPFFATTLGTGLVARARRSG